MTKNNLTDITIVLDKSSSMQFDKERTRSAVNEFIKGQQGVSGECNLTLVTFAAKDSYCTNWLETVWDGINIQEVRELSEMSYRPYGNTALYDAVGMVINNTGRRFSKLQEYERPSKVLFVVMTDGEENRSREFSLTRIRDMISHQESKYSWNFIFLGADFSTKEQTEALGLCADRSFDYSKANTVRSWKGLSKAVEDYRLSGNNKLYANFSDSVKTYADAESN